MINPPALRTDIISKALSCADNARTERAAMMNERSVPPIQTMSQVMRAGDVPLAPRDVVTPESEAGMRSASASRLCGQSVISILRLLAATERRSDASVNSKYEPVHP